MTLSEKICQDLNRKFYFDDFVLTRLFYYENKVEMEICDGLIEFEDIYILIQIKEQSKSADTSSWLKRKVYKKAVEQVKRSIDVIQNGTDIFVVDMYGQNVKLDSHKRILPLIIFKTAEPIDNYRKVYHSNSKDININIFSIDDYEVMLSTLLMPIDIINYLHLRKEAFEYGNINILIDESQEYWTSLADVDNEKRIAEYFLSNMIGEKPVDRSNVINFLEIIKKYHSRRTVDIPDYKAILNVLLRFDRFGADVFMQRWVKMCQDAKDKIFNYRSHIVAQNHFEKFGILFISADDDSNKNQLDYYRFWGDLFVQQYELRTSIIIIASYDGNGNFNINWIYRSDSYTEDKKIKEFLEEQNPWKSSINLK